MQTSTSLFVFICKYNYHFSFEKFHIIQIKKSELEILQKVKKLCVQPSQLTHLTSVQILSKLFEPCYMTLTNSKAISGL